MADNDNVIYDDQGHARHFNFPRGAAGLTGGTPQEVAKEFLRAHADVLQVPQDTMRSLDVAPGIAPVGEVESLRFEAEKRMMDSTVVSYAQTMFGLPIYQAGVSVMLNQPDNSVKAASSTLHYDIAAQPPGNAVTSKFATAAATGGYDELVRGAISAAADMRINRTRLMVYRYNAAKRVHRHTERAGENGFGAEPPTLPLPPVPDSIRDGTHYVVVEALFSFPLPGWGVVNWQAFIEAETGAVLFLRALIEGVTGLVFDRDPITKTGNLANLPNAISATLDACARQCHARRPDRARGWTAKSVRHVRADRGGHLSRRHRADGNRAVQLRLWLAHQQVRRCECVFPL